MYQLHWGVLVGKDGKRRAKKEKRGKKNVEKLTAGAADKKLKTLQNFGGIFRLSQLKNLKILSYPVGIMLQGYDHWLAIVITKKEIEIMDSSGVLNSADLPKSIRKFICAQMFRKSLIVTPKLQSLSSTMCGYFSILFLILRLRCNLSLVKFCSLFSANLRENEKVVSHLLKSV